MEINPAINTQTSEALESLRSIFRETTTTEIFEEEWENVIQRSPDFSQMITSANIFFQYHMGMESEPYKWDVVRDKANSLSVVEGIRYLDAFIHMGKNAYYAGMTCYRKSKVMGFPGSYEQVVSEAIEKKQILEIAFRTETSSNTKKIDTPFTNELGSKIHWEKSEAGLVYLFELLYKERLITQSSYEKRFMFIEAFFENKDGMPFKRRQSLQAETNSRNNNNPNHRGKPREAPQLEKLAVKLVKMIEK